MLISICLFLLPCSPSPAQPASIIIPPPGNLGVVEVGSGWWMDFLRLPRSASLVWHAINGGIRHQRAPKHNKILCFL